MPLWHHVAIDPVHRGLHRRQQARVPRCGADEAIPDGRVLASVVKGDGQDEDAAGGANRSQWRSIAQRGVVPARLLAELRGVRHVAPRNVTRADVTGGVEASLVRKVREGEEGRPHLGAPQLVVRGH
eukprot:3626406-Prymnesium_polylepis.1